MNKDFSATVDGVYVGAKDTVTSEPCKIIDVNLAGIMDDRHFGSSKISGVREKKFHELGTLIFNARQWSAVTVEELQEVADAMDVREVKPEWLGANILLRMEEVGKDFSFTNLPPMTRLIFPSEATLLVSGENLPCRFPAEAMLEAEPEIFSDKYRLFARAAIGKSGLVGWVERAGEICFGDKVNIHLP